jgi:hypothetical protein
VGAVKIIFKCKDVVQEITYRQFRFQRFLQPIFVAFSGLPPNLSPVVHVPGSIRKTTFGRVVTYVSTVFKYARKWYKSLEDVTETPLRLTLH